MYLDTSETASFHFTFGARVNGIVVPANFAVTQSKIENKCFRLESFKYYLIVYYLEMTGFLYSGSLSEESLVEDIVSLKINHKMKAKTNSIRIT